MHFEMEIPFWKVLEYLNIFIKPEVKEKSIRVRLRINLNETESF